MKVFLVFTTLAHVVPLIGFPTRVSDMDSSFVCSLFPEVVEKLSDSLL